ncbi:discoidin domain-containing protein [Clostridium guangxiense]|nr:discoidin domain-containing protein [Clostridium guangxiense]
MYKKVFMKRYMLKKLTAILLTCFIIFGMFEMRSTQIVKAQTSPYLISLNRATYASSSNGANTSDKAVDSDNSSRWESEWGKDNEWIYVDLGSTASLSDVKIKWEGAYASQYVIEASDDEDTWHTISPVIDGKGGDEDIVVSGTGRYVRLHLIKRALSNYGYSIYDFQVYGTGGLNPPPAPLGENIALNKHAVASSVDKQWYITDGQVDPDKAVDGNLGTHWGSEMDDLQWIYVDLGSSHTIGRVILDWDSPARSYDIEVSDDAANWKKVYRQLNGRGGEENIQLYATGRYVRMSGITRTTTGEFGLKEFKVYDYVTGDPQPVYTIPDLPTPAVTQVGNGSYLTDPNKFPQPAEPYEKTSNINTPIPSNDWWQSILIKNLGNPLITLPLKAKYSKQGLGVLTPSAGWVQGNSVETERNIDFYLMSNTIDTAKMNSKISGYGDYSASVVLSDNDAEKMKTTFVKGSPYIFSQFSDPNSVELYSTVITKIYDDNNNAVLLNDGETITADHIGIEVTNVDGAPTPSNIKKYYGIFAPQGTVFKKVGAKIKMQLGGGQGYLSIATMPAASNLNYFYQHAYAFVTDTKVNYNYDPVSSNVTTNFTVITDLKRTDLSKNTLMCMLPGQWKASSDSTTNLSYPSVRGTLKVHEGNSFSTVDKFNGIVPQFTEPLNDGYSRDELLKYLKGLDDDTTSGYMNGDAYWQGKALHPLAEGVLVADQIHATDYRDKFLARIKGILTNWLTYTPGETEGYYFDYNPEWGTLIYKNSEFGANVGITDHHFTYGYFTFASAVLASYDDAFLKKYGQMVEMLIRDYANPSKTDDKFPQFRNFDPYEGHSWAGGYADNEDGNNQEAAGESLFGWVGEYLWGKVSGNTTYRDAGIYGFTTELRSVKQYWFNYDGDNWVPDYKHKTVGQVYGASNFYGTFFSGDPVCIYGIHWLPTSEYLTNYGIENDKDKAAALYEGMKEDIIANYNNSTDPNKGAAPDPNDPESGWRHVTWPIESLSDPAAVLTKWDPSKVQHNETYNTYWFVNNMATLGQRTNEIWAENGDASVYKNGNSFTALIWNPGSTPLTVKFRNASGEIGYTTVPAKSLVSVNPMIKDSVSKSSLAAELKYVSKFKASDYTTDSWATLASAITVGKDISNNSSATYGQVNVAVRKLYSAVNGLVKTTVTSDQDVNVALNVKAVSSSNEADGLGPQNVTDGNSGTRWSSNWMANKDNHPEYVYVSLGNPYFIDNVKISWSDAYAKGYDIQVAAVNPEDESSWKTVKSVTDGNGGDVSLDFSVITAKYVRIYCKSPATQYGYSIKEIGVYASNNTVTVDKAKKLLK